MCRRLPRMCCQCEQRTCLLNLSYDLRCVSVVSTRSYTPCIDAPPIQCCPYQFITVLWHSSPRLLGLDHHHTLLIEHRYDRCIITHDFIEIKQFQLIYMWKHRSRRHFTFSVSPELTPLQCLVPSFRGTKVTWVTESITLYTLVI